MSTARELELSSAKENHAAPSKWGSYRDYGCRVNAWTVDQLFERYAQTRLLYPDKRARLAPHLAEINHNWRRAMRAEELILWVATHEEEKSGRWATVSGWRSTSTGWLSQHLASNGHPSGSRAVLLAAQAARLADGTDTSQQNWFRRSNHFAARVFGTFAATVGHEHAALVDYELLSVRGAPIVPRRFQVSVACVDCEVPSEVPTMVGLVERVRGPVFVAAEDLNGSDVLLGDVDKLYRLVGLRRYRRIWLAYNGSDAVGAALCYRGPLGFNFSFLENRCDLVLDQGLTRDERQAVAGSLLSAAQSVYADLSTGWIPVVTDASTAAVLVTSGAESVRSYTQSIWLRSVYSAWYDHVAGVYSQTLSRRRGLASS